MIYCPHCGTPNKPTSKFCKNCAALLAPSTDVRCPICGTMNPQGAATCQNCGTRLSTGAGTATGAPDQSTPADSPEQISPFTPPPLAPENQEPEPDEPQATNRPSFARANSEWLRRIQKTPPETKPASPLDAPPPPAPDSAQASIHETPAGPIAEETTPDWLRVLTAERERIDTANTNVVSPEAPPRAETSGTPASAIAGTLPFEANTELPPADPVSEIPAVGAMAQAPTAIPTLSEIKLTGDDYDYSDIGGQVTDEMKAQLEASASQLTSTDDEVELARRLVGLDMGAQAIASSPPPAAVNVPPEISPVEPGAPVIGLATAALTEAPTIETSAETPLVEAIAEAPQIEAIAEMPPAQVMAEAPPFETSAQAPLVEAIAEMPPAKPALSEIKLTGDDYDYSDIGGQVTDDMKAQLEASASQLTSTDDEVELARRLLGLGMAGETATPDATVDQPPSTQAAPQAPAAVSPEPEESPEWLIALAAASAAAVAEEVQYAPQAKKEEAEPVTPPVTTAQPIGAGTEAPEPETVAQAEAPLAVEPLAAETPAEPSAPSFENGELPDWLREIAPSEFAPWEMEPGETKAGPVTTDALEADAIAPFSGADEGEMPEWVKDLTPGAAMIGAGAMFLELPELDESERGELPDWLREPPAPGEPPPGEEGAGAEALLEGTAETAESVPALELPSWFKSGAGDTAVRDPFETIETTGPLAGVSGILPLALAITEPHVLTTPMPTRSDGGRIFQTILAEPLAPTASAQAETKSASRVQPRHLVYLILLVAALFPMFLPLDQAGLGLDASKSPSAGFYDQLQAVTANRAVLLVFDYTPGQAVELDPAARVIVNDLATRKANVIALSTNETGATIAQTVLSRVREAKPDFTFVNVGYLFGKEAKVSDFARGWLPATQPLYGGGTWGASPLARDTQGMNDLALTVLLTADSSDLRLWMEQAEPHVTSPIVAATSAQLEPQARNYVNANQLQGSLRGLTGAAELELLTNTTGQAVKTVDALSFVSLALAGIIILANLVGLMRRGKPENK